MSKCIIMSAGDFTPEDLHREEEDIIIAADNGLSYLTAMNVLPDYIIGDYDSLVSRERGVLGDFRENRPDRVRTLPKAKDDTDTMAAVRWGIELGYRNFHLYGALGGRRLDHTIANLQTLMFIQGSGGSGRIYDEDTELFLLRDNAVTFGKGRSGIFSLFAVDRMVRVTIRGLMFEGEDLSIGYDFPIGCSNEFLPDRESLVEVRGGTALIIAQRAGSVRQHAL